MRDPLKKFEEWYGQAGDSEDLADAMSLATADKAGRPSVRMVLLKGYGADGFVFYTNLESRKGLELKENPFAALCFHWKSQKRQVRVEGKIVPVSDAEADVYFASRAKDSRIGAWASKQSRPMVGLFEFEARIAKYIAKYALGKIPRPPFWSGFRVVPEAIEFWEERAFRLHDRRVYRRGDQGQWTKEKIYP